MSIVSKILRVPVILTLVIVIMAALAGAFYFRYYFVFGEGVKAGELNYVVRKGIIFKTYEGKLIQSGFKGKGGSGVQSYEFEFSIEDPELAEELMKLGGKSIQLHYQEYFGAIPWRGYTHFIVDRIILNTPEKTHEITTDLGEALTL